MKENTGENLFYDLVIQGDIVQTDKVLKDAIVAIRDGRISGIFDPDSTPAAHNKIDARGKYVIPGAIDAHVHCYSAPKERFLNATKSAAAGGVTTLIDMPYDVGAPVISPKELIAKQALLEKEALIDVALLGTIKKTGGLDQIPLLAEAGVCGFKVSLFETDPQRFPRIPDGELLDAFRLVKQTGLPIGVHAENDDIIKRESERQLSHSSIDALAHSRSRPVVAEAEASLRTLEFAYWTGARVHIYHVSHPRIFELVNWYRKQGVSVSAETCTHYLCLNEQALLKIGAKAKVNPPLRTKADQEMLWQLCSAGDVDFITSDHAPWEIEKKQNKNILANASGMPGVEMLLPMVYSTGVSGGKISITDMVRMISENPAKVFGLQPRKGQIRVGADADLVILDPKVEWTVDEKNQHSFAGWSPYHGWNIKGAVSQTIVRGKTVYDGDTIVADPGIGTFIRPEGVMS